jgi:hypothetical protein
VGFAIAVAAGVALAVPYVFYARRVHFAAGLVVAALIYVGFAIARGTTGSLLVELGGVALFTAIAFLGMRYSRWFLAAGWAAHVGWDLFLHPVDTSSYAPWWYPALCLGFDLAVAAGILGKK